MHEGETYNRPLNTDRIIIFIHELINYFVRQKLTDPAIHSGCASIEGKRFILSGNKAAGKTTLLCKLLLSGAKVYCDEHVLLRDLAVIPFPRKFHIKQGTLDLLPEIRDACGKLRLYTSYVGDQLYFFDPTDYDKSWKIYEDRLSAIFYLEPNHNGNSKITTLPGWQMVQRLMEQIDNFSLQPEAQIKSLCSVVKQSTCFVLQVGNLDEAVKIIRNGLN